VTYCPHTSGHLTRSSRREARAGNGLAAATVEATFQNVTFLAYTFPTPGCVDPDRGKSEGESGSDFGTNGPGKG